MAVIRPTSGRFNPVLIGLTVFLMTLALTQFLSYQRFLINKENRYNEVVHEINLIKNRLTSNLSYSLSATKTLAFLVEQYGVPENFDEVAKDILEANKNIDALELTDSGIITHIYPLRGNETAIGYNVLADLARNKEAQRAIETKTLFFAGPLELKQGGMAVVGRLPIFKSGKFKGFSVVLIRLSTLLKAGGIDTSGEGKFSYQLSKIDPITQKEVFFLPYHPFPPEEEKIVSVKVPDGEWKLYVMLNKDSGLINIINLSLIGFILSLTCGLFAWQMAKQPEKLNRLVEEKTQQLAIRENYFRSLIENSADAIVLIDHKGKVLYQTPSAEHISGYSLEEMQTMDGLMLIHPDDREKDAELFADLVASPGVSLKRSHQFRHKKGHYIWLEGTYTNLLNDENIKAIVYNYYDATERVLAEEKARISNRFYRLISRINQLMVHVEDENTLFSEACDIAVNIGKFKMAWVGMVDVTGTKVNPVRFSGDESEYLSGVLFNSRENIAQSNGPTGLAFRTANYVLCNDIENDPIMSLWRDEALKRGYRSSIALPIKKFGKVVGTFNLYSSTPHFFDPNEINLLVETTEDISFTLENFEKDRMRKQAEILMAEEKLISESIINSLPGIFYVFDIHGKYLRWNKNHEIISGYSKEEMEKVNPLVFFDADEQEIIKTKIERVMEQGGNSDATANFLTKSGEKIPYLFNGHKVTFNHTDYIIGMGIDITTRVKVENKLRERTAEIQKLTAYMERLQEEERTRMAREIHDELGQQLTGLKIDAHWLLNKTKASDEPIQNKLASMINLIDDTIITVRRIASELRPGILDDLGLVAALEWQGQEFEKRTGIQLKFVSNLQDFEPDRELSTNIFRVYQEALTNISRHAQATSVETLLIRNDENLTLEIKDNGCGFDEQEVKGKNSLGLTGMKERALLFNGTLKIESKKLSGTTISLRVPISINNLSQL